MLSLSVQLQTNSEKAGPYRDKAIKVKKEADALFLKPSRLKFTLVAMGDKVVKLEHKGKIVEIEENTSFSDLGEKKYAPFAEIKKKRSI